MHIFGRDELAQQAAGRPRRRRRRRAGPRARRSCARCAIVRASGTLPATVGDADHLELGAREGEQDGDGVVLAGIGVDDDGERHGGRDSVRFVGARDHGRRRFARKAPQPAIGSARESLRAVGRVGYRWARLRVEGRSEAIPRLANVRRGFLPQHGHRIGKALPSAGAAPFATIRILLDISRICPDRRLQDCGTFCPHATLYAGCRRPLDRASPPLHSDHRTRARSTRARMKAGQASTGGRRAVCTVGAWLSAPSIGARRDADRAALHQGRPVALCGRSSSGPRRARSAIPTARWCSSSTDIEVPEAWSQVAADILAQKYFRKAGVPARLKQVEENDVPSWLWRSVPDEKALAEAARGRALRLGEIDSRAGLRPPRRHLDLLGLEGRLFRHRGGRAAPSSTSMRFMLATQMAAPNSPQWFNTGLHWAYGIDGPGQGHFYVDHKTGKLTRVDLGLRASAAACLLHPVGRRRPRQRGRHHGPVGARGAPVQIRLGHRLQLLRACAARARSCRAAAAPPA